jgi:hypothetical protein
MGLKWYSSEQFQACYVRCMHTNMCTVLVSSEGIMSKQDVLMCVGRIGLCSGTPRDIITKGKCVIKPPFTSFYSVFCVQPVDGNFGPKHAACC